MTGVITWDVDRGDGVCIEREQPSTVCRSMTQFATFVQPQNVDIAQMGELRSEHLGAFKALNETTNVSPPQGDSTSIVHLEDDAVASDHIGALKPSHIVGITVDPKTGDILGPIMDAIIDPNETYDVAVQSLIDDMMTGYRLKDVIITSFDNADAITNGGSTSLQENCANGTFLQANYANGNWLDKSSTKYSPGKGASFGAKQGEGWTIIESMVNQDNMQGLDAGGMNYAEAVGLDSSTVDVVDNINSICGGCGRHGTPWQADV